MAVDVALHHGQRGLPGDSSLALLLSWRLCGGVRFIGVACDNGDPGTGLRQAAGNSKADAAVTAGHQRRFSRQVEKIGHAAPPFD
jgi:hypothetical protein